MPRIRERKSKIMILLFNVASVFLIGCLCWVPAHAYTVFFEDFDPEPQPGWYVDNGVWEVGVPTYGPDEAFSSPNCAGTVLSGNYPGYTDSHLISPVIELPNASPDEEIWVRFWQWFAFSYASGTVQVQTLDEATGAWSAWTTVSTVVVGSSPVWSPTAANLNLTVYAGHSVRIAFLHTADSYHTAAGWYVDDVSVEVKPIESAPTTRVTPTVGW